MKLTGVISGESTLKGVTQTAGILYETDYNKLKNKPQIEHVELVGNKSLEDIGVLKITNAELAELLV